MFELISGWHWLGGAAAFTFIVSCFGYIKNAYLQVLGRVVVSVTVSGYQADAILLYLQKYFSASRFGPRTYIGWKLYFRPSRRVQLMPMEVTGTSGRLYWRSWRPIWVSKSKQAVNDLESGVTAEDYNYQTLTLVFARGMFDPDELIRISAKYYNEQTRVYDATDGRRHSIRYIHGSAGMMMKELTMSRGGGASCPTSGSDIRPCLINRPLGFSFGELGMDFNGRLSSVDRLALTGESKILVDEVRRWRATEQWHYDRYLPWRRGFLLHGAPGTGKTALARAVAEEMDLPIYVYDLASLRNDEFQRAWNHMLEEVPCMALIEDIDAVFHGRENVAVNTGPGLTFDCLLNCLDGVQRADGLITIMTTNHLERVDPAIGQPGEIGSRREIGSRPGRIDRVIGLAGLDEAGRRKIARRILCDSPDLIEEICSAGTEDTPAQFQERCSRTALSKIYESSLLSFTAEELLPF